jgi:hypothetical protein
MADLPDQTLTSPQKWGALPRIDGLDAAAVELTPREAQLYRGMQKLAITIAANSESSHARRPATKIRSAVRRTRDLPGGTLLRPSKLWPR